MKSMSRTEANKQIEDYFSKDKLEVKQTKKIKKLAMIYRIQLKEYRKRFCKKCYSGLGGKTRISKKYKTVICKYCSVINRWMIK